MDVRVRRDDDDVVVAEDLVEEVYRVSTMGLIEDGDDIVSYSRWLGTFHSMYLPPFVCVLFFLALWQFTLVSRSLAVNIAATRHEYFGTARSITRHHHTSN
jgi:hypothetical protein